MAPLDLFGKLVNWKKMQGTPVPVLLFLPALSKYEIPDWITMKLKVIIPAEKKYFNLILLYSS